MSNGMIPPFILLGVGALLFSGLLGWSEGVSNEREHMCRLIAEVSDIRTYFFERTCYQLTKGELSEVILQSLRTPESPN